MKALLNKDKDFKALTKDENQSIAASLLNLEQVVNENIQFNIPIYQRLYVWKIDQIRTLLEDLKTAFYANEDDSYFLGGIMLSSGSNNKIDLVDGQQRFTTLWIICNVLSEDNSKLKKFIYSGSEPRIHFSIRENAQQYLKDHTSFNKYIDDNGEVVKGLEAEISEIIPLASARRIIINLLNDFKKENQFNSIEFAEYLYSRVQFSQTFIPIKSDMNRVFEAMNNRGKQLAHHELLKSKLLNKISSEKRLIYSLIWDACSDMTKYIEKSIKDVANLDWKDIFSNYKFLKDNDKHESTDDSKYNLESLDIVKLLGKKKEKDEDPKTLAKILSDNIELQSTMSKSKIIEDDYSSKKVRSIISFPTFLLHVLRVYQSKTFGAGFESSDVNDKKLIENFNVDNFFVNENSVTEFILLLWDLRIFFDRFVIKWVYNEENKEEYHEIENIQISKNKITNKDGSTNETISIQRVENTDKSIKDLIFLQGMLYHSQEMITQYWLTPFLHFLSKNKFESNVEVLNRLEILDNELFHSSFSDKLKDRTYSVIFKDDSELLKNLEVIEEYLKTARGTQYPNYIFYKLEYILWKSKERLINQYPSLERDKWFNYRLTAKNSVEHIYPQNAREENKHLEFLNDGRFEKLISQEIQPLDDFGNLVLLSPGMNSEYSNKSYTVKKASFVTKSHIDSLKSALIFKETGWNYDKAISHRDEMIEMINDYITLCKRNLSFN